MAKVNQQLYETYVPIAVNLPYQQGALISLFHEYGQVDLIQNTHRGVTIQGMLPGRLIARFQPYTSADTFIDEAGSLTVPWVIQMRNDITAEEFFDE